MSITAQSLRSKIIFLINKMNDKLTIFIGSIKLFTLRELNNYYKLRILC